MSSDDAYDTPEESNDRVVAVAVRWTIAVIAVVVMLVALVIAWRWQTQQTAPVEQPVVLLPEVRAAGTVSLPDLPFTNVTESAGIHFIHRNGATGRKLLPETMGSGCAFFDYDADGDPDLFFVNGTAWPDDPAPAAENGGCALYENDGFGNFRDVSPQAGVDKVLYGMGVAVGDYNNDGYPDLFLSALGQNVLLRNQGGHFEDVTAEAGVGGDDDAWSTSCAWFDMDNDGDLDLIVGNYVKWSRDIDLAQDFRLAGIGRAYGPPLSFEGAFPYLYRNEGDGRFTDVTLESGLRVTNVATDQPLAKTLGVAPVDVNGDGWMDIILANDTVRNLLFINQRSRRFEEQGIESGIAYDASGKARGAMGIDAAHFRNDSSLGVAIGNFANEMTALYVGKNHEVAFTDDAILTGLGPTTRKDLSFALFFLDVDLDGRLDLFTANGHLEVEIYVVQSSQTYRQPPRLFWNAGTSRTDEFLVVSQPSDLQQPLVGRGASYADMDHDGDLDIVITQVGAAPVLLRNEQHTGHNFVRLKLIGKSCNRDAIGARVVMQRGSEIVERNVMPTRGYLSQVELPVTIGLGSSRQYGKVRVIWPGLQEQEVHDIVVNGTTVVVQE